MGKVLRYENGLTAVVESTSAHSVSAGIWVNAGSANEDEKNNGISHFIEHMMFKGTDKLGPFDISKGFENRGAMINAFTSKDNTCYFFKSIAAEVDECFGLLAHIFLRSVFDKVELDRERKVVIEEINMQEDSPEDVCFDLLAQALYDGSLSKTIIGPAKNVLAFEKPDIESYMNTHYTPANIVISFAGGISPEKADELVKKHFLPHQQIAGARTLAAAVGFKSGNITRIDKYEQANLMLAFPSVKFNHPEVPTQSILSTILGGGMSSRLFQNIREKHGLAYSVYTSPSVHTGVGSFNFCVNYTAANTGKVLDCLRSEIDLLLKGGISDEEFERAKTQLKSSMVFSQENPQSQMMAFGKLMLIAGELFDMDKRLGDINAVTKSQIMDFAEGIFKGKTPALSYLGKKPDIKPIW